MKKRFFRVFSLVFSLSNAPKTVFKARLHSIIARRLPRANPAIGSAYDPLNKPQECQPRQPAFGYLSWSHVAEYQPLAGRFSST